MTHWTESLFLDRPDLFVGDLQARLHAGEREVEDLLALLDGRHDLRPGTALDAGCGIGRHAVALAERGVETTGVDIATEYLVRARDRAADAGVTDRTAFVAADLRHLGAVDARHDLVVNAWTTFGYYDEATNRAVLSGLYDRVADGGALVVELVNREGVLASFVPDSVSPVDGRRLVESREYDPATARMHTERWVHDADGGDLVGRYEIDLRLYAPVELAGLCRSVGFDDVSLYAGFDGSELSRESTRLAAVAERAPP